MCDTQFALILFFLFFGGANVQSKRTTRAEPEDHLWSADHSLRNAGVDGTLITYIFDTGTTGWTVNILT
jgi:hypothetical protein